MRQIIPNQRKAVHIENVKKRLDEKLETDTIQNKKEKVEIPLELLINWNLLYLRTYRDESGSILC